ncbi:MAG: hypothetical protein BHW56_06510 [Acetobacter sp. 46_36]|nr:MAG: hypothetical protein BHW56_06510 [Acetobacter sp. 46_36]
MLLLPKAAQAETVNRWGQPLLSGSGGGEKLRVGRSCRRRRRRESPDGRPPLPETAEADTAAHVCRAGAF